MGIKSLIIFTGGFALGILAVNNKAKIKQYWTSFLENFSKVDSITPTTETTQTTETSETADTQE
jgi:basic membrane lipoprotein Med (substrate-binding protein (PBP1-ABC) superfamily)